MSPRIKAIWNMVQWAYWETRRWTHCKVFGLGHSPVDKEAELSKTRGIGSMECSCGKVFKTYTIRLIELRPT